MGERTISLYRVTFPFDSPYHLKRNLLYGVFSSTVGNPSG